MSNVCHNHPPRQHYQNPLKKAVLCTTVEFSANWRPIAKMLGQHTPHVAFLSDMQNSADRVSLLGLSSSRRIRDRQ
jgi:hypothetical protein